MLEDIDHIGIAVSDLDKVIKTFEDGFGLEPNFCEEVADQKVRIAGYHIGDSLIEYLEPTTTDSSIARFLEKRNNSIHHIAFRVKNLEQSLKTLKKKRFQLIDEEPRIGVDGKRIAFIHPASCNGILIELCEVKG
jgi:methylmalonyl-CoA/ethylmalonyl-CoA epimerase